MSSRQDASMTSVNARLRAGTAAGAPPGTAVMRGDLRRADGSAVRVLVVDDESTLSELLTMALRYEGWDVRAAPDGLTAVRLAREFRPDAVVLDVMLPDIDGLEVLRRLRAETPLGGIRAGRCARGCSLPSWPWVLEHQGHRPVRRRRRAERPLACQRNRLSHRRGVAVRRA